MIKPDWSLPFEIMCDASDYAVEVVLGQIIDKHFKPLHYASKTMNEAQENYMTTEKELLVIFFTFDKFRQYLVLSNTIICDKKGAENLAADHLSRLKNPDLGELTRVAIRDLFPEERLMAISDKNNKPCVLTESYKDVWPEMKQHKFFNNVTAGHPEDTMASPPPQGKAIELYDEEGSEFIVKKQRVKPYQKNLLDTNKDDDVNLDDEGEVMLYLMRRSLEVLRKFHWMILGGQFNQLSHVSSPFLSKPGEY
ncbi:reverse transcriptase domain-containing protein [Tanacetum coccineum]|uniref:Reverse transcriptase domain-containing protein n=1 Tax=Tanacetum coccineum TaxID=301880 RepID=A0ABQ5CFE4_9ASTR